MFSKIVVLIFILYICFFAKNIFANQSALLPIEEFEKIEYILSWNTMSIGEATLKIKSKNINGVNNRHAKLDVVTNKFFSSIFSLNAYFKSLFEHNASYSFEFVSKILQNGKQQYEQVIFDQQKQSYKLNNSGLISERATLKDAKDILTALYYIRTLDLKVGNNCTINLHAQDISAPITIKVLKNEILNTIFGQKKCFVVEPFFNKNSAIDLDAKLYIWITADAKKLPVYIKIESNIGVLSAKLTSISNEK